VSSQENDAKLSNLLRQLASPHNRFDVNLPLAIVDEQSVNYTDFNVDCLIHHRRRVVLDVAINAIRCVVEDC
jgi:hypothetical protein